MGACILVVCTANVCRSPLAELLLTTTLARLGVSGVAVSSAGARHVDASAICPSVRDLHPSSDWIARADAHRPAALNAAQAARADLILTASRSNRRAVARLAPETRSKTFTLTEIAWLGAGFRPSAERNGSNVVALAEYLDSQRGLRSAPRSRTLLPNRAPVDPLTVVDGHNMGALAHRRTIRQVTDAAETVARLLVR